MDVLGWWKGDDRAKVRVVLTRGRPIVGCRSVWRKAILCNGEASTGIGVVDSMIDDVMVIAGAASNC